MTMKIVDGSSGKPADIAMDTFRERFFKMLCEGFSLGLTEIFPTIVTGVISPIQKEAPLIVLGVSFSALTWRDAGRLSQALTGKNPPSGPDASLCYEVLTFVRQASGPDFSLFIDKTFSPTGRMAGKFQDALVCMQEIPQTTTPRIFESLILRGSDGSSRLGEWVEVDAEKTLALGPLKDAAAKN